MVSHELQNHSFSFQMDNRSNCTRVSLSYMTLPATIQWNVDLNVCCSRYALLLLLLSSQSVSRISCNKNKKNRTGPACCIWVYTTSTHIICVRYVFIFKPAACFCCYATLSYSAEEALTLLYATRNWLCIVYICIYVLQIWFEVKMGCNFSDLLDDYYRTYSTILMLIFALFYYFYLQLEQFIWFIMIWCVCGHLCVCVIHSIMVCGMAHECDS